MKNLIYFFLLISFFSYSQVDISLDDFASGNYPIGEKIKILYNKSQLEVSTYTADSTNSFYGTIFIDSLFYREVTFKKKNIPEGPVKDYYLEGDLMT